MKDFRDFKEAYDEGWLLLQNKEMKEAARAFEIAHFYGVFSVKKHFLAHYAKLNLAKACQDKYNMGIQFLLLWTAPISLLTSFLNKIKLFFPIHPDLEQAILHEMQCAKALYKSNQDEKAIYHAGRAHILGNHFWLFHTKAHWLMLKIEIKHKNLKGILIQTLRTLGALGTRFLIRYFGVTGNTGETKYPIGAKLPLSEDLKVLITKHVPLHMRR